MLLCDTLYCMYRSVPSTDQIIIVGRESRRGERRDTRQHSDKHCTQGLPIVGVCLDMIVMGCWEIRDIKNKDTREQEVRQPVHISRELG